MNMPKVLVASGYLVSKDPTKVVRGTQLESRFCEVHVTKVLKPCELLLRPTKHVKTFGDAIGETIVWLFDNVLTKCLSTFFFINFMQNVAHLYICYILMDYSYLFYFRFIRRSSCCDCVCFTLMHFIFGLYYWDILCIDLFGYMLFEFSTLRFMKDCNGCILRI